jgi:hypothetical protein
MSIVHKLYFKSASVSSSKKHPPYNSRYNQRLETFEKVGMRLPSDAAVPGQEGRGQ